MPRKAPLPVDTSRKLAGSKIWNGAVYSPGMEDRLPEDFPMDGPHWADHEEEDSEAPKGLAALNMAAQEASGDPDGGDEPDQGGEPPADGTVAKSGRRAAVKKTKGRK